jgi:hypothetical protein
MQIDSTPVDPSARDDPSDMKFDEDMSDMEMILPQRGSLEGVDGIEGSGGDMLGVRA